jgi:hypothetical protein
MLKLVCRDSLKDMVAAVGVDVIQYYMTRKHRALIRYGRCICVGQKNFFRYSYRLLINP